MLNLITSLTCKQVCGILVVFIAFVIIFGQPFKCRRSQNVTTSEILVSPEVAKKLIIYGDSLQKANNRLKTARSGDSLRYLSLLSDLRHARVQIVYTTEKIKKLTTDENIALLTQNLTDKEPIAKIETDSMGIKACMNMAQVTEINITFAEKDYLKFVNDIQTNQIILLENNDKRNMEIVGNYELMLNAKDSLDIERVKYIAQITGQLEVAKRDIKRQKAIKRLTLFGAVVLTTVLIIK